jgi:UPF0176 protein
MCAAYLFYIAKHAGGQAVIKAFLVELFSGRLMDIDAPCDNMQFIDGLGVAAGILAIFGAAAYSSAMWTVAAFYRFVPLENLPEHQAALEQAARENGICGTVLLANEGINGTVAGIGARLEAFLDMLDALAGVRLGALKYSTASKKPFLRAKIKCKREIITLNAPEANPALRVGHYVKPEDWNALLADPAVMLIDTRNDYESAVGIFKGAIDPKIQKFTQFKGYVAQHLDPARHKKIAMFCTGGIRCEKASSYLLAHGFEEVYHLEGGILKYLETVPEAQSLWQGECFVFDRRVAVGHGLREGVHDICYGCRFPLAPEDKASPYYEAGVSCPHCHATLSDTRRAALRMRHQQMQGKGGD